MKRNYAAISTLVILALGGCAKHHADQNASTAPSASQSVNHAPSRRAAPNQPTSGTQSGQPAKVNIFNKEAGDPNLVPVSSSLQKPIPVSWYDLELMDLYMINKAGLRNQVSHNGLVLFFEPEKYGIALTNVFDRKAIVQSATAKAQSVLAQVPTDQPFTINTQFNFNPNYNFQGQYFPMKVFNKNSSFSFSAPMNSNRDNAITDHTNSFTGNETLWPVWDFSVQFTNYKCIGNLDMPSGQAKTFLNSRTDGSGNINNALFAKVNFAITGYKSFSKTSGQMFRNASLYAKLLKVTVYNDGQDANNGSKPIAVYNCQ